MTMGLPRGMGPVTHQHTKINKCEEFHTPICSPDIDKCCAIVRCAYCMSFIPDGSYEEFLSSLTTIDGVIWSGTINDSLIELRITRNYEGNCVLEVYQDDYLIETIPFCQQPYDEKYVDCRDLSSSVQVTINGESGTLRWYPLESRRLQYTRDENNCVTYYCGNCECTCSEMCAVVYRRPDLSCKVKLTLVDSYECVDPVWEGFCEQGYITVTIFLERDEYTGGCIVHGTAGDKVLDPIEITDCKGIDVAWVFDDGTNVAVKCKDCAECEDICPCCPTIFPPVIGNAVYDPPPGHNCGSVQSATAIWYCSGMQDFFIGAMWIRFRCENGHWVGYFQRALSAGVPNETFGDDFDCDGYTPIPADNDWHRTNLVSVSCPSCENGVLIPGSFVITAPNYACIRPPSGNPPTIKDPDKCITIYGVLDTYLDAYNLGSCS